METKDFSVSECLSEAWVYSKKHWLIMCVIFVIIFVIEGVVESLFGGNVDQSTINSLAERMRNGDNGAIAEMFSLYSSHSGGSLVSSIVSSVLTAGVVNMMLGLVKGYTSEPSFDAFKMNLTVYVKYVVAQIIYGIIVVLGLFCCILPGIFFAIRFNFCGIYLIENKEAGIVDAFKASWAMTSSYELPLLGLSFMLILIVIGGILCCCVGMVFAMVIVNFAEVIAYIVLSNGTVASVEAEQTGYQK